MFSKRELEIIEKRATDVDPEIQEEYKTFLRHFNEPFAENMNNELLPEECRKSYDGSSGGSRTDS